ncbi:PREDICTED: uncharacterized protein LOC104602116 isoform X1 [Nelumbo nucifera]|uniref:Uncharacterized protein LOC104602116 isoform X1 n=2 Tax=Nelumbo nucifera TaxID=4432 RepID=A0A1U8ANC6_NELNU|nr:PREDICTED: uncharacterized protein LOC104602116 isoform X1 [Nelumbo nucifera]
MSAPVVEWGCFCDILVSGAEMNMNGMQNRRARDLDKPFPGCMGRMVNFFDLSAGIPGNKLLTEKAHRDGYFLPRSRSEKSDPIRDQMEDNLIGYELSRTSSSKKSRGTPMKMLIAQEMSKETESKEKPPGVVAKLMGLDALPGNHPDSTVERSRAKGYLPNSFTQPGTMLKYQHQERQIQHETRLVQEQKEYKDVYEVWQQSPKGKNTMDKSPQKGRYNENLNEKKMDLVRQKFIEAKRLATDENLRQSKEFQDALEVLSANKELFLKFLQEPNSLFAQRLCELQSIPPPPETKRITVLRPSKTLENSIFAEQEKKDDRQIRKQMQVFEANKWDKDKSSCNPMYTNQKVDVSAQPTRIVVLKPSPGKTHDIKALVSSPPSSPRLTQNKDFCVEPEDDEARGSREVAKEITRQMRENLSSHRRDETLMSSVFSNGYIGDESSFNRSANEYVEEGNLSDSEVMTPTSRHTWDYINRFDSPYSSSSFSRASYSPESSVCKEAKKRLSERWAMMASNGSGQEQKQLRRSSSTLGEMLALSETKSSIRSGEDDPDGGLSAISSRSCGDEQDLMTLTSCLSGIRNRNEGVEVSPEVLPRSRSVPASSTAYGMELNVEFPDPNIGKSIVPKEESKSKGGISSFKGKIFSLVFSRNKKPCKEKSCASPLAGSQGHSQSTLAETPGVAKQLSPGRSDDIPQCVTNNGLGGGLSSNLRVLSNHTSSSASNCVGTKQGSFTYEAASLANQEQPSPISVLEAPFEDDADTTSQLSGNVNSDHQGPSVNFHPLRSNLIDKSPPIGSVARTLSWDDSCLIASRPNSLNFSRFLSEAEEEQDQFLFFQALLSTAGLDHEEQADMIISRWHSPESPLDPSLIEKCISLHNDKEILHEAKHRQRRSNKRLLFDCVNAALVDMMGYSSEVSPWVRMCSTFQSRASVDAPVTVDKVWSCVKKLYNSSEGRCYSAETGDSTSLVVEKVVRKEVAGRGWEDVMRLEVDTIGKQIEGEMLEQLVQEALVELTGWL